MPAHFESGVLTDNQPAWHGAGVVVPDEALTKERVFELVPLLASDVIRVPLYGAMEHDGEMIVVDADQYSANVRVLDKAVLGVMGNRYTVCQNEELFDFAESIVDTGGALWKTAGTLKDGKITWGLLQLPGDISIAGVSEERLVPYLMVTNSFDGTSGVQAVVCWTRVVCSNTLAMALREAPRRFSIRHTESLKGRLLEAKQALGVVYAQGKVWEELGATLIKEKLSQRQMSALIAKLLPMTPESVDSKRIRDNIEERRLGMLDTYMLAPNLEAIRGTKWGALNAVVEFEQHHLYQDRDPQRKLQAVTLDSPKYSGRALELLTA